jgi:hypothetical protein
MHTTTDTPFPIFGDRPADRRAKLLGAWRAACEEAWLSYAHWCSAPASERALAHAVYVAAADREAAAAEHLSRGMATA